MKYPTPRCPVCKKTINDPTHTFKNKWGKESSYIKKHISNDSSGVIKYKCSDCDAHVDPMYIQNDLKWYEVYFSHPIYHEKMLYRYQDMKLYSKVDFIDKIQTTIYSEIIHEIRQMDNDSPLAKYMNENYPEFENFKCTNIPMDNDREMLKLKTLLLYLAGCSEALIASILGKKSRSTIATIMIDLKRIMGIKDFSFNRSITYYAKKEKVILSDFYNKHDKSDFKIIREVLSKTRERYKHLSKWYRMQRRRLD